MAKGKHEKCGTTVCAMMSKDNAEKMGLVWLILADSLRSELELFRLELTYIRSHLNTVKVPINLMLNRLNPVLFITP